MAVGSWVGSSFSLVATLFIALSSLSQPSGIVHRFEPIRGKVVDDKTEAPLNGAVVVVIYSVALPSFGGEVSRSVEAAEAVTGADGSFEIPSRLVFGSFFPGAWFEGVHEFYALRKGYGCLRDWSYPKKMLRPDGTVEFRLRSDLSEKEKIRQMDGPFQPTQNKISSIFQIIQSRSDLLWV